MIFRFRHGILMRISSGTILLLILSTLLSLSFINNVKAENIDVDKKYSSIDIIDTGNFLVRGYNSYDFKLKTNEKVEYRIDVIGDGYVNVFLMTENDPSILSEYVIGYSTEEDIDSYHKTFNNEPKYDTEEFSILIFNPTDYNVTYEISIKISDDSWGDATTLVLAGILIFCVFVLPIIIVKYIHHKKETDTQKQKIVQYPCNNCGNALQYIEPNKQWFCNICQIYIPGENQNEDRSSSAEYLYGCNR